MDPVSAFWRGRRWRLGWLEVSFLALVLAALGLRLWELGGRTMHYDEAIHVHYSWRLANGEGFIHSPWMHGPFQIEFTALIFRLFGDSDFTARLGYVLFGTALVGLPYLLRDYLGRVGSLLTGVMLALSPALLYFSRFGRNDILMAFWATALLVLVWRYIHEGKDRYLYLSAAVLAAMFATKETAYFVALAFGAMLFLLALPQLVPWALGRIRTPELAGPAGAWLLLVTLTLPQWSAAAGLAQDTLGLTLVNGDGVSTGLVGAPQWAAPYIVLPVYHGPWWFHAVAAGLLVGAVAGTRRWRNMTPQGLLPWVAPLAAVAGTAMAIFQPIDAAGADFIVVGLLAGAAVVTLAVVRYPWKRGAVLVIAPALLTLAYAALFTPVVNVDALVNGLLPSGIQVDASANGLPVNYLVAGGVLAVTLLFSIYLGVSWLGGAWLTCAAIFYGVWVTLYTTIFTNWAGVFSGVWQGMGYWIAQQEVARGGQPWYYYFVALSVYELLPVIFGTLGAVYFLKRGDALGLALAFWAGLSLLAYSLAGEKMPWLIVNITLPFILVAGKYLGELVERVSWRRLLWRGEVALLLLPPVAVVSMAYLLLRYVDPQSQFSGVHWAMLLGTAVLALLLAYLVRLAHPRRGLALVGLGIAGLLLVFGTTGAFRAVYTYDDSYKEILVYAQGSADLATTYRVLERQVFQEPPGGGAVTVDYDLWYPFNWYVRHHQKDGVLRFACFKAEGEDGWTAGCNPVAEQPDSPSLLLSADHGNRDAAALAPYQREGPLRNLLWFPESYRRPGENRRAEGFRDELAQDFQFFKEAVTSRQSWSDALDYLVFRRLDQEWYYSQFYRYLPAG